MPEKRYDPNERETEILSRVDSCITEAMRWHRSFANRVEERYSAWRGMAPENMPRTWRSNQHPPLLINIVEGMISSMEENRPTWRVTGRAVPGMEIEEAVAQAERAELNQHLLTDQMRIDKFSSKQRPFIQQDLIAGYTPGKIHWLKETRDVPYLDSEEQMVYDEGGGTIDLANVLDEKSQKTVLRDDPTFEPRDVRDFLYPGSATSVEKAPWIIDRTFVSYDTVEKLEALGVYKNCDYLKETDRAADMARSSRGPDIVAEREQRLRGIDRTRGLVELVELWDGAEVFTVGNRRVVLRDSKNNFWHGRKPFVVCSAIPDMFQIPGLSVIEGLAALQEMLWTLTNMRLDATRLMTNVITLIRGSVENADDYEYAPEAQWIVNDPNEVKVLEIPSQAASVSLQAEALIRGDIQNLMGGLPFTGGAQSQTVDQNTATGVSIVTNIAQQILAGRKQQYLRTFADIGSHFLALDQQFIRKKRLVEILGEGGSQEWIEFQPESSRGIFDVDVEVGDDSLMRQERRAESGQLLTQANQFAGVSAQMGVPLNLRRFWEKHLDAFGIEDKASFFMPAGAQGAQPAQGPPQPGGPTTPGGTETLMEDMAGALQPGGITNESLAAGPTSPSSPVTMSPAAPMQQALAAVGSGRSV